MPGATINLLFQLRSQVLELAGNASKDLRFRRIAPRCVMLAIRGDEELDKVVSCFSKKKPDDWPIYQTGRNCSAGERLSLVVA